MTGPGLTPYWHRDDQWAGVLLLIVPATRLPIRGRELARLVRDRVEHDPALYDLVVVVDGPPPDQFEDRADWHRAVLQSLVAASMPQQHFLAPRAALMIVIIGERSSDVEQTRRDLVDLGPLRALGVQFVRRAFHSDARRLGVAPQTVQGIADLATKILDRCVEAPEIATAEADFLAELAGLVEQGLIRWQPAKPPPLAIEPGTSGAQAVLPAAPLRDIPSPAPPHRSVPVRPVARPARVPQAPVFHYGDDTVVVDNRPVLGWLRSPAPTDAEALQHIAETTTAVSLTYLVLVPDEVSNARRLGRDQRTMALKLDQLLGTVVADSATGEPMQAVVEVFTAVSPLHRHGLPRLAGELTEDDLPRARADVFDHAKAVEALLGAADRTTSALQARGVEVLSRHYLFVSSIKFLDANTIGPDWDRLLRGGRATWIEMNRAKGDGVETDQFRRPPRISPSPYGFHVVSDRYDVVAMIREESAVLYTYASPPRSPDPAPAIDEAGPGPVFDGDEPEDRLRRSWLSRLRPSRSRR